MTNPFIEVTKTRDRSKMKINVNHIVGFQDQTYSDSPTRITYIILNNTGITTVHVTENFDKVSAMIEAVYKNVTAQNS